MAEDTAEFEEVERLPLRVSGLDKTRLISIIEISKRKSTRGNSGLASHPMDNPFSIEYAVAPHQLIDREKK